MSNYKLCFKCFNIINCYFIRIDIKEYIFDHDQNIFLITKKKEKY